MTEVCYRDEQIGLFGCPVDENPTVLVMEAAFRKLGLKYRYNTTLVYPEDLEDAVKGMRAFHWRGTHVTVPHKVAIIPYLDELTETAQQIGAVNTVYEKDGKYIGENTDGKGFIRSLDEAGVPIKGQKIVLLGAGGAARALSVELAKREAGPMVIVNRTPERGKELVDHLNNTIGATASYEPWNEAYKVPEGTDMLINATSIGLYPDPNMPDVDFDTLSENLIVCDIIPNPLHTKFLKKASEKGCRTFDGFSMLVNQAAVSFKLWTGLEAPIDVMKEALLTSM